MKIKLNAFIDLLPELARQVKASVQQELEQIAPQILETVQNKIGAYQEGWEPLADATQKEREEHGYSPDNPLLRTGNLRNSYSTHVNENQIIIGSFDPDAEYMEIGTTSIPPRPILLPAIHETLPAATQVLGAVVVKALSDKVKD